MKYPALLALIVAGLLLPTSNASASVVLPYTLTYDPTDGSLTIDTFGNPLYTYSVKGLGDLGVDDGFIQENHLLLLDAPGGLTLPANSSTDDELSQSDLDGWTGLSPFSLGEVLDPGLSQSEFDAIVDPSVQNTFYVDELGELGNPKTFKAFDIVFVPEPSSLIILGLGVALLAQRRRTH